MDSQHRRDLKENDLYEFVVHFKEWWATTGKQWWARYGNILLVVLLLVLGSITAYRLVTSSRAASHENAWSDLAGSTSPEVLRAIAEASTDPTIKSLALLRSGDLELTRSAEPDAATGAEDEFAQPTTPEQRERMLDNAANDYRRVLDLPRAQPLFKLNAQLGLAAVAESRGNTDEARQHYQAVQEQAADVSEVIAAQARGRIAMLDRLDRPVTFTERAPAAETDAADPLLGGGNVLDNLMPQSSAPQSDAANGDEPAASDTAGGAGGDGAEDAATAPVEAEDAAAPAAEEASDPAADGAAPAADAEPQPATP